MSLCHLYDKITRSVHIQKILDSCEDSVSLDLNILTSIDDYDIYILELQNIDKDISLKLKKMFEHKKQAQIYFINFKDYSLILFQLIILLEVKYLITENQDTDTIIDKINSNIKLKQDRELTEPITEVSISHRLTFVEMLKDKLLDKITTNNHLSIITIGIQDEKRLQQNTDRSDVEIFLSGLLAYMDLSLEKKLIFSQYDRDFYVALFEDIEFEEVKKIAYDFYSNSMQYISKKDFKLLIDIFVFNLEGHEFTEILDRLEDIQHDTVDKEDTQSYIQRIGNVNKEISEHSILLDAFKNNTEFKLLNIYNGLCINTPSHIVKNTDDSVYIRFEQLQGVIINIDKYTIMQSSNFLKDIQADVKYIDLKKRVAILENFKFLDTNANSRKYSRVTPSSRMPITVFLDGSSLGGDILDLSIKSIAIKSKYSKIVEIMHNREIKVVFNIPSRDEVGYTKLILDGTIVFSTMADNDGFCKIVCDITEEGMSESLLMEYVYDRQKELIIELKKMVKLQ